MCLPPFPDVSALWILETVQTPVRFHLGVKTNGHTLCGLSTKGYVTPTVIPIKSWDEEEFGPKCVSCDAEAEGYRVQRGLSFEG